MLSANGKEEKNASNDKVIYLIFISILITYIDTMTYI